MINTGKKIFEEFMKDLSRGAQRICHSREASPGRQNRKCAAGRGSFLGEWANHVKKKDGSQEKGNYKESEDERGRQKRD